MKTSGSEWQERYEALRQRERHVLLALLDVLSGSDASREEVAQLQDAVQHLSGLFCLAVIGEFNAGKSTLLNALLGARLLPEGVTPTTSSLHLVTYGPAASSVTNGDLVEWQYPAPWLKDIYLVDTPGSNTVFRQHEARARSFLHRADLLLFVISARRALAESDRLYLDLIHDYGAKIVVILNQIDLLNGPDELAEVSRFVQDKAQQSLGQPAPFFAVSAKWALQAAESKDEAERQGLEARSGITAVRNYINGATAELSRARQQLLTSLRVGTQIVAKQKSAVETRLAEWRQEGDELTGIRAQIVEFQRCAEERQVSSGERLSELMAHVAEQAQANLSHDYGLGRVFRELGRFVIRLPFAAAAPRESGDLALASYLRADAPAEIEEEWQQTESALRKEGQILLAGVAERANKRLHESPALREKVIGEVHSVEVAEGVGPGLQGARREIERALDVGGLLGFVKEWSRGARNAWWRTVIWEIAVILLALAFSYYIKTFVETAERTRWLLWIVAGAVGAGAFGLCWLPLRRVFARRELSRALDKTRVKLAAAQKGRIESLTRRYVDAAETVLSPYSRATSSEQARLGQAQGRLAEIEGMLREIELELARDGEGVV
jgi:small GTP-binding protein